MDKPLRQLNGCVWRCTLLLGCILLLCTVVSKSQDMDSLKRIVSATETPDTVFINRLIVLARSIQFKDPVRKDQLVEWTVTLSRKIRYRYGLSVAYGMRAVSLINAMKLDSAEKLSRGAYELIKNDADLKARNQQGILFNIFGVIYQQRQLYDSAVVEYLAAEKVFRETGNIFRQCYAFLNLSSIYAFLGDHRKTLYYARLSSQTATKSGDPSMIIQSNLMLCNAYIELKQFDSVRTIADASMKLSVVHHDVLGMAKFQHVIGTCFLQGDKQYDSALVRLHKALLLLQEMNNQYDVVVVLENIGTAYLAKKDYPQAIRYLTQCADRARATDLNQVLKYCLWELVKAHEESGQEDSALFTLRQYVAVSDTVQKRNNARRVQELEMQFQTSQKEAQLQRQQAELARKNTMNYLLMGGAAGVIIISLLLYRTYSHKQKLQQQRIVQLEGERQLMAMQAVLQGEEQERARLAKDLHDGLGGLLSGIKYSFNSMKENLIMTPENQQAFERSMDLLDSSIKEMRRVAHNMMPEALVRYGLDKALNDFCDDIDQSGALQITYQSWGLASATLNQSLSLTIYRVVQELINNCVKHAAAKSAIVQVTKNKEMLTVTVEDDGQGFDTGALKEAPGIGWANIRHRVNLLNGKLDIDSKSGKGTSVHMEFIV